MSLFENLQFADFAVKSFTYAPPPECRPPWAKVVLNFDLAVTAGRQYDRTGNIWVGGVNVYFGTTAEPSRSFGPSWHIERDLTDYSAIFTTTQLGSVYLGNLVNSTYTGILNGSAKLQFYPVPRREKAPHTADLVLPLSAGPAGGSVYLYAPMDTLAATFDLPSNVESVYLDVVAQSQGGDEFWFSCAPNEVAAQLQNCGNTGFREAEITLDGAPAGVAPVYPWIYTGGVDPALWHPIPGVQTLSFQPYRVNLTPFAALLADGRPHTIALNVFNNGNYFATTATLLVFQDHGSKRTTGALMVNTLTDEPTPVVTSDFSTANEAITGTAVVTTSRSFKIAGYVNTSHGRVTTEIVQSVQFSNEQQYTVDPVTYMQTIEQNTRIVSLVRTKGPNEKRDTYMLMRWPFVLDYAYTTNADGTSQLASRFELGLQQDQVTLSNGHPVYFSRLSNTVAPRATRAYDAGGYFTGYRQRESTQRYRHVDSRGYCHDRTISAAYGVLTAVESGCGLPPSRPDLDSIWPGLDEAVRADTVER